MLRDEIKRPVSQIDEAVMISINSIEEKKYESWLLQKDVEEWLKNHKIDVVQDTIGKPRPMHYNKRFEGYPRGYDSNYDALKHKRLSPMVNIHKDKSGLYFIIINRSRIGGRYPLEAAVRIRDKHRELHGMPKAPSPL